MYNHFNERSGQKAPLIADDVYEIIMKVKCMFEVLTSISNFALLSFLSGWKFS